MPPKIATDDAARMLARAIIEDVAEYDEQGLESAAGLAKGRALFADKVAAELHHVFDEVLAEYII